MTLQTADDTSQLRFFNEKFKILLSLRDLSLLAQLDYIFYRIIGKQE